MVWKGLKDNNLTYHLTNYEIRDHWVFSGTLFELNYLFEGSKVSKSMIFSARVGTAICAVGFCLFSWNISYRLGACKKQPTFTPVLFLPVFILPTCDNLKLHHRIVFLFSADQ